MRVRTVSLACLSFLLTCSSWLSASATTTYQFTITYHDYNYVGDTEVYTFQLSADATPDCVNCVAPGSFTFDNVAFNVHGDDPTVDGPGTDTETFFTTNYQNTYNPDYSFDNGFGGGTVAFPLPQQYFTGSVANPTFKLGTFQFAYGDGESAPDGTLVIAGTPEPSSLLLLGTGLSGTVCAARRRFLK